MTVGVTGLVDENRLTDGLCCSTVTGAWCYFMEPSYPLFLAMMSAWERNHRQHNACLLDRANEPSRPFPEKDALP